MPSYSNRVPFSLYPSAPSDAIRLPFESKNRPPATICGTPVATLLTASGNVRNSMEVFVPLTARIFGHRSAATTSGSSARTLKNRLATGLAPCKSSRKNDVRLTAYTCTRISKKLTLTSSNKSVSTMPGESW